MPLLYALAGLAFALTVWMGWYANKHGHDGELPIHKAEAIRDDGTRFTYVYVEPIEREYQDAATVKQKIIRDEWL
jgi:hypothetical protein